MKTKIDLQLLQAEIKQLDFWIDGSGALMAFRQNVGILDFVKEKMPLVTAAIAEIEELLDFKAINIMTNILPPGISVPFHWDNLQVGTVRWHLPVRTNSGAGWTDEKMYGEALHMPQGYWYGPIPYTNLHAVWNFGIEDRIHLVVDLRIKS